MLDAFAASPGPAADPELDQLTSREQEVLRLISVLDKLQLWNRHEADPLGHRAPPHLRRDGHRTVTVPFMFGCSVHT